MNKLADTLDALDDVVAAAFVDLLARGAILATSDGELLDAVAIAARLQRRMEALLVELAGKSASAKASPK